MALVALIDDDEGIRPSIRKMIEAIEHTVIEFDDAAPAMHYLNENNVDLIVTDLRMKTPGRLLITSLRESGTQTPILIITGQVGRSEIDRLLEAGANSVLFKPFLLDDFQNEIQSLLNL